MLQWLLPETTCKLEHGHLEISACPGLLQLCVSPRVVAPSVPPVVLYLHSHPSLTKIIVFILK